MSAKFSPEKAQNVWALYASGFSVRELARKFSFSKEAIRTAIAKSGGQTRTVKKFCQDEIINLYLSGQEPKEISMTIGCDRTRVYQVLGKNKIKLRETIPLDRIDQIVSEYEAGFGSKRLAKKFGIGVSTVKRLLHRLNVKMRPLARRDYSHDESSFDKITPESAYWIGLLMSDGCVGDNGTLSLSLKSDDAWIVRQFRQFLKATNPVAIYNNKVKADKFHPDGLSSVAFFSLVSRRLVAELARYGVVPRKTKNAKVIGLEMNRDFWRGMIDGDGSIYHFSNRYAGGPAISLVGSLPMMRQFSSLVRYVYPFCKATVYKHKSIFSVTCGFHATIAVVYFLYHDCPIALPRKLVKANEIIQRAIENGQIPETGHVPGTKIRRANFKKV